MYSFASIAMQSSSIAEVLTRKALLEKLLRFKITRHYGAPLRLAPEPPVAGGRRLSFWGDEGASSLKFFGASGRQAPARHHGA